MRLSFFVILARVPFGSSFLDSSLAPHIHLAPSGVVHGREAGGRFWSSQICSGEGGPDRFSLFLSRVFLANSEDLVVTYSLFDVLFVLCPLL